jgi:hypothetical protein
MAKATDDYTIIGPIPLSALFTDSRVRDAFRRAERDAGAAFAVPAPSPSLLSGGAIVGAPEPVEQGDAVPYRSDLVRLVGATLLMATIFVAAMLPVLR